MSTEGAGKACVVAGSPVILGIQAAVGAGILVEKGVMWVSDQIEKNYLEKCQTWSTHYDAAQAKNQARAQVIQDYMTAQWYTNAASGLYRPSQHADTQMVAPEPQEDLLPVMAQVRSALDDMQKMRQVKRKTQHEQLVARLLTEIEIGRGVLSPVSIAQAEAALGEASESVEQALDDLDTAWKQRSTVSQEERQRREVQFLLQVTANQLSIVEQAREHPAALPVEAFVEQRRQIEATIAQAQAALQSNLALALELAEAARGAAQALSTQVSTALVDAWDRVRKEINTFQGVLTALTTMVNEAIAVKMISRQRAYEFEGRIEALYEETEHLVAHTPPDIQARLLLLKERVGTLKQDVFAAIEQQQQRYIAQTIATTLDELGFQDIRGDEPTLKESGDLIRVVTTTSGRTTGTERDDKIVSFDIARNGDIAYDFSGYVGDTCVQEAERIFVALHKKGIFILDAQAAKQLPTYPTKLITPELLEQPQWQPQIVQNKLQAELAERLRAVLEAMNYPTISQNVVGGCIELEAFSGPFGYRVVLAPDGAASIFKDDAHTDISDNEDDPLVAEVQQSLSEQEGTGRNVEKPGGRSFTKRRNQHKLEH